MMKNYILEGHKPVPCSDLARFGQWFETADRKVAYTVVGDVRVSTVFLGMDHQFGEGEPLLFETMVFPKNNWNDLYCARCSTWEQAEAQHAEAVMKVKDGEIPRG